MALAADRNITEERVPRWFVTSLMFAALAVLVTPAVVLFGLTYFWAL